MQKSLADIKQLHQQGNLAEAKQGYLAILKEHPDDVTVLHLLGVLYAEEGDYQQAEHYLKQAIAQDNDPAIKLNLANIYRADKSWGKAENTLLEITRQHPQFAAAYNNLGTIYFAQGEWKKAREAYQKAIDLQTNYTDAYYNLGLTLNKLSLFEEAKFIYEALLALNSEHSGGHFQLGLLFMRQQKYAEAIKCFLFLDKIHPFHLETQINLATCYLQLGDWEKAQSHYLRALKMDENDIQILFNLGVIHMQRSEIQQAIDYYLRVIKLNPNLFDAQNNLAFSYLVLKNPQAALTHFREALRIQPNNKAIQHTIDILTHNKDVTGSPPEYIRSLFDSYANYYESHLKSLQYQVPNLLFNQAKKFLANKKDLDVLDLGCGTGLCGELFRPYAKTLVGIDLSSQMLAIALQKHLYDELIEEDVVTFFENSDGQYDLIVAGDVLVYMGDLREIFQQIVSHLKSQGLFIFNAEVNLDKDYDLTQAGRFSHSKSYLEKLVKEVGLEILSDKQVTLRTQEHQAVTGYVFVLRRN